MGHNRTHAPQQIVFLLDQLGGTRDQYARNVEAQRLRCLHIDGQFKLVRSLHWETAWLGTAKDFVDVVCGTPEEVVRIDPIGDQAASCRKISEGIDRGQSMSRRQRNN